MGGKKETEMPCPTFHCPIGFKLNISDFRVIAPQGGAIGVRFSQRAADIVG